MVVKKEISHLDKVRNNSITPRSKRGQSDIIATLLIILLVIIAGGILMNFLVPYVQGWLSKGDCFQFNGKVNIINDPKFTCYDENTYTLYLKVGFGDFNDNSKNKITGLTFITQSESSSNSYVMIYPNSNPPGVSLLTGDIGQLPEKNQERTYKIMNVTIKPNSTIIYPLIDKKRKCSEVVDTMEFIPNCDSGFMSVNTSSFISGGVIPTPFTDKITINNIPTGTGSLALIINDINDTAALHGAYYNIPKTTTTIDLGAIGGTPTGGDTYTPLNKLIPPPVKKVTHYYIFTVYAINDTISSAPASKAELISAIKNLKVIGQSTLYGKITSP